MSLKKVLLAETRGARPRGSGRRTPRVLKPAVDSGISVPSLDAFNLVEKLRQFLFAKSLIFKLL
jgi:hypothetical protein